MNNVIIVPTDFSAASLSAANYAADFALATNSKLALIHIWYYPLNIEVPPSGELTDQLIKDATTNIEGLKQGLAHKTSNKIEITTTVREGFFIDELKIFCEEQTHALLIMGAHVTSATERIIFGSKILSAMQHLSWPLIIVPNGTRFTGITNVGLACDLHDAAHTVHAEELLQLFNAFHPTLNILHVSKKQHGLLDEDEIKNINWLKQSLKVFKPAFHTMQNENVSGAIREFAEKNNLNLLIIVPKNHGLFNKLHKSQSNQLIVDTHIPILSFHE